MSNNNGYFGDNSDFWRIVDNNAPLKSDTAHNENRADSIEKTGDCAVVDDVVVQPDSETNDLSKSETTENDALKQFDNPENTDRQETSCMSETDHREIESEIGSVCDSDNFEDKDSESQQGYSVTDHCDSQNSTSQPQCTHRDDVTQFQYPQHTQDSQAAYQYDMGNQNAQLQYQCSYDSQDAFQYQADVQGAQLQYQYAQPAYQYNFAITENQPQYQYAQPFQAAYQYDSRINASYPNLYTAANNEYGYCVPVQTADYSQPPYGTPIQMPGQGDIYSMPIQTAANNGTVLQQTSKKKITLIVIITVAVIMVLAALSVVFVWGLYSIDSTDINSSSYTDEQPEKQPTYNGERPALTVRSIPEGTQPYSAKEIYNMTYKSIVQIYAYDESVMEYEGVSYGSGFIISDDGYILTNAHVLMNSYCKYKVIMHDGTEYDALLVAADNKDDIGIIKVDAVGLHEVELGDSSVITMGDKVYTIGNPSGPELSNSFCEGIISGINRTIQISDVSDLTYFQTDAGINPGNSGGPLLNEYGQVIGINTGKIVGYDYDNLGFSIPLHQALPIIGDLFRYGYVKDRVRIGASFEDVSRFEAMLMDGETGVRIVAIDLDSDLNNTKLKEYDIITHINGVKIDNIFDLQAILTEAKPGDRINMRALKVDEDGEIVTAIKESITLLRYIDEF